MSKPEPWEESMAAKIAASLPGSLAILRETIEHRVGISGKREAWKRLAALWSRRRAETATTLYQCQDALALRPMWPADQVADIERLVTEAQVRLMVPAPKTGELFGGER